MTFQKAPEREEEKSRNKRSPREGSVSKVDFAKELNAFKRAFKMRIEIQGLGKESH